MTDGGIEMIQPVCHAEIEIPYCGGFGLLAKTLVFTKWNEHVINHKIKGEWKD